MFVLATGGVQVLFKWRTMEYVIRTSAITIGAFAAVLTVGWLGAVHAERIRRRRTQ